MSDEPNNCMDVESKPKSKCSCLKKRGKCCLSLCVCRNCGNIFGSNDKKASRIKSNNKGNIVKSFKRAKGAEFLKETGYKVIQGSWSGNETVASAVIARLVPRLPLSPTPETLCHLYNWLAKLFQKSGDVSTVRYKSKNQVASKECKTDKLLLLFV